MNDEKLSNFLDIKEDVVVEESSIIIPPEVKSIKRQKKIL